MEAERKEAFVQYLTGIPAVGLIYYLLALAILAHLQVLADNLVETVPWYYHILGFFLVYPFFGLVTTHFEYFRPIFAPLQSVFGSNADSFIIIGLQGVFWGFVGVFCFRLIRRFRARRGLAANTQQSGGANRVPR